MKKNIYAAVLFTLLATGIFAGVVQAQEPVNQTHNRDGAIIVGLVYQINSTSFMIEKPDGETLEISVGEHTHFRQRQGEERVSFDDLEVGTWVAVKGHRSENGNIAAVLVILLPEDFAPENFRGRRVTGEVTKINNGQDTFTINTRSQDELTFSVNERTQWENGPAELKDLEKGMHVVVLGYKNENGSLVAKVVAQAKSRPSPRSHRVPGRVADLSEASITLTLHGGKTETFAVTENTKFRSLDGSLESYSELAKGRLVVVFFEGNPEGDLDALAIIATGEALEQALENLHRAAGEVQSAGGTHLRIQTPSGETLNFVVDEGVRIRGLGPEASLNDIKNGMRVMVLYKIGENDDLIAQGILVFSEFNRPPRSNQPSISPNPIN